MAQPKNISQIVPFLKPLIEYFPFCKKTKETKVCIQVYILYINK